jgi:hypothetical protein
MRSTACWVLAMIALAGGGAVAADEPLAPVTVHAHVEPDHPTIGQRFRYTMEVSAQPGVEVVVTQPSDRLGDFEIVDFGVDPPAQRDGRTLVSRWWRLVGWSPGEHAIESPPVRYRLPGEEEHDAAGDTQHVTVASVLGDANERTDIRDIAGPEPVPRDLRPWYLAGGVLAGLIALALGWQWLRRRRRRAGIAVPPRPPHEIAAEALRALRARRLPEVGEFKEFYSTLSDIVRRYLEDRFHVRAPEMTTEEFLVATARGAALERAHRALLGTFLGESDLVKFARFVPTLGDSERALAAAERFVDDTAERERVPGEDGARAAG